MADEGSLTHWIVNLQEGKEESLAQQHIWNCYFERLTALARMKLRSATQRVADEEDVVLAALNSFFDGVGTGKFPQLTDRNSLWPSGSIDSFSVELVDNNASCGIVNSGGCSLVNRSDQQADS